jgi:glutathione S-transferase
MTVQHSPQPSTSPRLRLADAARYLGVAPRSLASGAWRRRHRIPVLRIGRALIFETDFIDRWLEQHREKPTGSLERRVAAQDHGGEASRVKTRLRGPEARK